VSRRVPLGILAATGIKIAQFVQRQLTTPGVTLCVSAH
jgi:hypothetical protein